MEWLTKMNSALDYIEQNLTAQIDLNEVCKRACCSSYNFQRMFSFITDVTLAEYIRRRRLTAAAFELQSSDSKVIDVAMKYGYDSATSFARAFSALHGINPKQARRPGVLLKAYPKISFQISIKGEKEMNYRIETKEDFHVFGIEIMASLSGEEGFLRPDQLWKKCQSNGEYDKLYEDAGGLPEFVPQDLCRIHAVENYRKTEGNTFSYMLFAFATKNSKTDGYTKMHIPSQTYAVFSSDKFRWDEFNDVLSGMQKRFYSEWLPTANYERVDAANFEIYGGDEELGYLELWFPVNKK